MPPATAPLTGTTASRSSGGSGESDSSPGNISGQDSASAAPPDDGESSMVPRRDKAAAAGRARGSAPCLREGEEESAVAGPGPARQAARTRLSSFPAAHCGPLGRCSPPAAGARDPGREVAPGCPGRGWVRAQVWVSPGGGRGDEEAPGGAARQPVPSEPLGMQRGRRGWAGGVAARGRPL